MTLWPQLLVWVVGCYMSRVINWDNTMAEPEMDYIAGRFRSGYTLSLSRSTVPARLASFSIASSIDLIASWISANSPVLSG
jgi:hypothetical protein